ncbi:hypothetical protein PBY51_000060 [Eleginops maclovinus]|uniref:Uncharacterized protein n=1 Tax=Eleginops maclovinus TaxID=56733 RepID=A0AAN7XKU1_ELEMC|nr:hypothetical protein PBY51_000060 [Eleginops maclovinus]
MIQCGGVCAELAWTEREREAVEICRHPPRHWPNKGRDGDAGPRTKHAEEPAGCGVLMDTNTRPTQADMTGGTEIQTLFHRHSKQR